MKELFCHLNRLFWQYVLSIQSNFTLHVDALIRRYKAPLIMIIKQSHDVV